jgi:putative two-component system response regulator
LAFVDVRMPPGWDGIETVRRIWNVDPALEVVICTAYSDYSWQETVRILGRTDRLLVLKKPFDNVEVRQMATALLRKWELARKVEQQTRAIREAHQETIHRLVRASLHRDEETGAHIQRTGWYSELMAQAVGWDSEAIEQIRLAAPMHDIGKIGIPDSILRKPGKLTPEEVAVMRSHTLIGAKMLEGSTSPVLRMARDIALCHHEHWDGRGYPAGLAGASIPETARIVAIVDVYDALSHDRVYHKAFSEEEILRFLREGRGSHFDPHLVDVFLSLLPEMRAIAQAVPDNDDERNVVVWHDECEISPAPPIFVPERSFSMGEAALVC